MIRYVIALGVLFAFFVAPTANATFEYSDQTPAPARLTALAQGPALQFWRDRNVPGCISINVYVSKQVEANGWAAGGWCNVWLSASLVEAATGDMYREDSLVDVCTAVVHEVGHALGLPHSTTGVMSGGARPAQPHGWAPWFCWGWARRSVLRLLRADGIPRRFAGRRLTPVASPY